MCHGCFGLEEGFIFFLAPVHVAVNSVQSVFVLYRSLSIPSPSTSPHLIITKFLPSGGLASSNCSLTDTWYNEQLSQNNTENALAGNRYAKSLFVLCVRARAYYLGRKLILSRSPPATLAITIPTPAQAQFNPDSFFGGSGFGGFGGGDDDDDDDDGFGFGSNGFFNFSSVQRRRMIHGILGAFAFAVLFPVGAIALKILPGRAAFWFHVLLQMAAWVVYIAAAGLGFWLVKDLRFPGQNEGWLVSSRMLPVSMRIASSS